MVIHITTDEGDYMRCLSWREAYRFVENKMEKEIREQRLAEAAKGYKEKYVWQDLDGEGYHD